MAIVRFGEFESDLDTGELFKLGRKIPLEAKPFRLLATLLERPGQLVTREDLREKIWPPGTYVDFGRCVNIAVTKLRHALSDTSDNSRYIETLPKRGYRFIAPVEMRGNHHELLADRAETGERKIRIAIVPFEHFGEIRDQGRFSEWLIDEIIAQLGSLYPEHVGILARTSNLKYSTAKKSVLQIGRDLRVDHILSGSVRISTDHARVTAQLTAVGDQTLSWSGSYDCDLGDMPTFRSEVATKVTRAVGREVLSSALDAKVEELTRNRDAYLEYLKGRQCHSMRSASGFWKSIQHFERAIYLDPNFAPAYCGLANARGALGGAVFGTGRTTEFYQEAKEAALRAVEINNRLADCHTSLAIVRYYYEWDWAAAERSLSRAAELDPSDVFVFQIYSRFLSSMRRHEEAIEKAKRLCELDPLSSQAHFILGEVLYFARQYDKALESFKSALEFDEMNGPAMMGAGNVYSEQSKFGEAISQMERALELHPENTTMLASLGGTYARAGRLDKARMVRSKLKAASQHRYVPPFDFALVTAGLGEKEKAVEFLQRAYQESSPLLAKYLLPDNPKFDGIRDDSRYSDLIRRIRGNNRPVEEWKSRLGN
jgi:DNA-binding winged helix-turn-helix (wHTH) protein/tetratricopeptide (TPR) repeat protein